MLIRNNPRVNLTYEFSPFPFSQQEDNAIIEISLKLASIYAAQNRWVESESRCGGSQEVGLWAENFNPRMLYNFRLASGSQKTGCCTQSVPSPTPPPPCLKSLVFQFYPPVSSSLLSGAYRPHVSGCTVTELINFSVPAWTGKGSYS